MNVRSLFVPVAWLLLCATIAAVLVVEADTGALGADCARTENPDASQLKKAVPVLFVHGWSDSSASFVCGPMWNRVASIPNAYPVSFDYFPARFNWVTDRRIGKALKDRITELAATSRKGGGAGKVIIVAHSMGGLAAREAASLLGSAAIRNIELVVTVGTPHNGSWVTGKLPDQITSVWHFLPEDVRQWSKTNAAVSMAPGTAALEKLPSFPLGLSVESVSSEISFVTYIWEKEILLLDPPPGSDIVVNSASARGGYNAGDAHTCGNLNVLKVNYFQLLFDPKKRTESFTKQAPCWHSNLMFYAPAIDEVQNRIQPHIASMTKTPEPPAPLPPPGGLPPPSLAPPANPPVQPVPPAVQPLPEPRVTNFVVSSTDEWQETQVFLREGDTFAIDYQDGTWSVDFRNHRFVTASGYEVDEDALIYQGCKIETDIVYGKLLGLVGGGEGAQLIEIGSGDEFDATSDGPLSLRMHDTCLSDNDGSVRVTIESPR